MSDASPMLPVGRKEACLTQTVTLVRVMGRSKALSCLAKPMQVALSRQNMTSLMSPEPKDLISSNLPDNKLTAGQTNEMVINGQVSRILAPPWRH